jgi:nucleotide-binding universal stress UspA family protein
MAEDNVESNSPKKSDVHIGFANFERILVAYDGTEMSKSALSYAAYFSNISHSEIVLINVLKANRDLKNLLPLTIKANVEQMDTVESQHRVLLDKPLRGVLEEMRTACKAAGVTKNIVYEIRMGNPADEIINVSSLMHFDLIIMGSRRISSRIEAIGSTTRRVLTKVKAPLLIVQKQPTYKDEY